MITSVSAVSTDNRSTSDDRVMHTRNVRRLVVIIREVTTRVIVRHTCLQIVMEQALLDTFSRSFASWIFSTHGILTNHVSGVSNAALATCLMGDDTAGCRVVSMPSQLPGAFSVEAHTVYIAGEKLKRARFSRLMAAYCINTEGAYIAPNDIPPVVNRFRIHGDPGTPLVDYMRSMSAPRHRAVKIKYFVVAPSACDAVFDCTQCGRSNQRVARHVLRSRGCKCTRKYTKKQRPDRLDALVKAVRCEILLELAGL